MKNSTQIIIAIVVIILITTGVVVTGLLNNNDTTQNASTASTTTKSNTTDSTTETNEEKKVVKNETPITSSTISETNVNSDTLTQIEGKYVDYKPELLANADQGPVVLFFHANWCPTCRAMDRDINNNGESFKKSGITLLKVDFDTATDLKKQYNITSQSSFVKVDRNGKELKKASALVTVDSLSTFANN